MNTNNYTIKSQVKGKANPASVRETLMKEVEKRK